MKLKDFFRSDGLDRCRKREALQKVLTKLEATQEKLEKELRGNGSGPKLKHLHVRLRTNRKQREKTKRLIAELDQGDCAERARPGLITRRPLFS